MDHELRLLPLALIALLLFGCTINPQDSVPPAVKQNLSGDAGAGGTGTGGLSVAGNNSSSAQGANQTQVMLFTLEEVAKHNTKADCWMVIQNYVLDLSTYAGHPGGDTYVPYCGKDGTEGFATKGGRFGDHSNYAYRDAEGYIIGELGKPMPGSGGSATNGSAGNSSTGGTSAPSGNNTPPPGNGTGTANNAPPAANASNSTPAQQPLILTMEEVAKHSTAKDCWMVIYGKVLNLTVFSSHPGGSTYVPYCGTEATAAFDNKGGRGNSHSGAAVADLTAYTIGTLGQPQSRNVTSADVTVSGRGDDDDGWEDD